MRGRVEVVMGLLLKKINWKNIKLPFKVNGNLYSVQSEIIGTDWQIIQYEEKTYKLIISNRDCKMAIYLSTMTIQTALNHPKSGKTQLTRKNITQKEFGRLLKNPRYHTDKGYHTLPK
jgi:hypothetical protein